MLNLTGLHTIFLHNVHIWIKLGFSCFNGSQVPREILKTESDRSGDYRGNLDQSIVRG